MDRTQPFEFSIITGRKIFIFANYSIDLHSAFKQKNRENKITESFGLLHESLNGKPPFQVYFIPFTVEGILTLSLSMYVIVYVAP